MATAIAELSPDGVAVYPGDYDAYLVGREARRALLEARARNQAKRVAEIERFIERFRYQATKARQVQSRVKMLERVERIEAPGAERRIRFAFPAPPRSGRRVAALTGLHKAYGDNAVYAGVDFTVERGERVALVGVNGAGKSTLLKILAGTLAFERGERVLGAHVAVHYYAQHQLDALTPSKTVLEELTAVAAGLGHTRLRTILGAFRFSGDAVDKRVAVISGGEKARLALAKMLVRPAALLCLDEPTNHLDLASREVLEAALAEFPGTIVFISHDRYFINRIASAVVEIAHGRLTRFPGGYDDYLAALARAAAPAPAARGGGQGRPAMKHLSGPAPRPARPDRPTALAGEAKSQSAKRQGKRGSAEVRELRRRVEAIEAQIHGLERRLTEIGEALADPALYADGERARSVAVERKRAEEQIARLLREWEALSTALAGHD